MAPWDKVKTLATAFFKVIDRNCCVENTDTFRTTSQEFHIRERNREK